MVETAPRSLRALGDIPLSQLRHIGPKRTAALGAAGLETVFDLLTLYPRRYIDRSRRVDLSDLVVGDEAAVFGEVKSSSPRRTRHGKSLVDVTVVNDGATLKVAFFNQPWRTGQLATGVQAIFFGKVSDFRGVPQMTNPVVDVVVGTSGEERDASRVGGVVAIYPASGKAGITSWELGGFTEESLKRAGPLADPLSNELRRAHSLVDRTAAYWGIHLPRDMSEVAGARRRLVFDEFLRLQLLIALRRRRLEETSSGVRHPFVEDDLDASPCSLSDKHCSLVHQFLAAHRFALTQAQRRVLGEIGRDMSSGLPMHRLLQGDVGSGKTVVALTSLLMVLDGGRQGAFMAPTEVLAEQHLTQLRADVSGLKVVDPRAMGGERDLVVQLLTGRVKGKERQSIVDALAAGAVDIVVGTHALLTDDVRFKALGAVVIDEQHRFGVEQRALLRDKGREHSEEAIDPDLLVMTATPIPRTAALVDFGDLDRSVLDEMPAGRRPVVTSWATTAPQIEAAWHRVREEVGAGRRAYVICPLVDESEKVEATSAVAERTRLATHELAGLSVGLLHGQMKSSQKDEVMVHFRAGEIQVLVATVVVEVGVDVSDASVIVIEDAWRFGLAQLHQLRGRVGRGDAQSFCYLLGEAPNDEGRQRLEALVKSDDGFALAEVDLDLRGEGTILGARQRGRSDLRLASLRHDEGVLNEAREVALQLVKGGGLFALSELIDELRLFVDDEEAQYLFRS